MKEIALAVSFTLISNLLFHIVRTFNWLLFVLISFYSCGSIPLSLGLVTQAVITAVDPRAFLQGLQTFTHFQAVEKISVCSTSQSCHLLNFASANSSLLPSFSSLQYWGWWCFIWAPPSPLPHPKIWRRKRSFLFQFGGEMGWLGHPLSADR